MPTEPRSAAEPAEEKGTQEALRELNNVVGAVRSDIDALTTGMGKVLKDGDPKGNVPPDSIVENPCCEVAHSIRVHSGVLHLQSARLQDLLSRLDA